MLNCEVIPLYCDVDGTFPNHHPDPEHADNLQDLIRTVLKLTGADIGLAFDGDGDRLGVVDNHWATSAIPMNCSACSHWNSAAASGRAPWSMMLNAH